MPRLLLIASAPVMERVGGRLFLDTKFVEGMRLHRDLWDGPVDVLLWRGAAAIPFGADYDRAELGFALRLLDSDTPISKAMIADYDIIAAAGDLHMVLDLPELCKDGPKLVYAIEYTHETRLEIIRLDQSRGWLRKLRTAWWTIRQERHRRAAFQAADGVQANGFPAFEAYKSLNPATMLYLDNRMRNAMMVTDTGMTARSQHLRAGGHLRLIHSGRLEPMKGAQDLIPIADALRRAGTGFALDIYGSGSLAPDISAAITTLGLTDHVTLHDPVDFETELVPILQTRADVFLSCHRQSDPSCTYLESMGCGLPVLGYRNAMWEKLQAASGAGWVVPMGDTQRMAAQITALSAEPDQVMDHARQALYYAKSHSFEVEFGKRMDHLAQIVRG